MSTYQMLIEKSRKETWTEAEKLIQDAEARAEQERARAEQEKLAAAAKMKKNGLDHATIADIMSLPMDVVEKL